MVISNDPVSAAELREKFPNFFNESSGDLSKKISRVTSPDNATESDIIFLSNPKAIEAGLKSKAAILVVPLKAKDQVAPLIGNRTVLYSRNPELAMATVITNQFLKTPYTNAAQTGVHPSAVVSPDSHIASGVRIGPNAFIGANVTIGAGTYVGANAVIEDEVTIGENTVIHPLVFIGHNTQIGNRCEVHPNSTLGKEGYGYAHDEKWNHFRIPHQGRVVLEDEVHIGASCTIDRGTFGETRIKFGAKLDNQIHIAHNCIIGRNALLTSGFTIAGSSKIGDNFVTGGGTLVTGHIEICDNVQLAGFSGVTKSITEPGQYGGHPLQPLQQSLKTRAAMTHLPEMRKQISKILKQLGIEKGV